MAKNKDKLKTEDFIEALQSHDARVVETLTKALQPLIQLSINSNEALSKILDDPTAAVKDLKTENACLTKDCEAIKTEDNGLKKQLEEHSLFVLPTTRNARWYIRLRNF